MLRVAGSGHKTNARTTDFFVAHLSGTEHALVKKHGYEKGLALTNLTSMRALGAVLARQSSKITGGSHGEELRRRSIVLIPFYGGVAKVQLDNKGMVAETELPTGAGNSHTLAGLDLKLLQLAAVVASSQAYFGVAVVGVVNEDEAAAVLHGLRRHLPLELLGPARLRVTIVPCGGSSVFLPYRLLRWMQDSFQKGGLLTKHENFRIARVYRRTARHVLSTMQLAKGSKGPPRGHKLFENSGATGGTIDSLGSERTPFDIVYYTEADNVVFFSEHSVIARAILGFLKSPKKIWRQIFFEKKIGDKNLAIFRSKKGVWGEPGFVRRPSSVVKPKTRTFRLAKKGQVAKKNETADDGGGCVSAALNGP